MNRRTFLRDSLGAAVGVSAAFALPASAATKIAPAGDDVGFLQWGATAELVSLALYDRALHESREWGARGFDPAERKRLGLIRAGDAAQLKKLRYTLQRDAPKATDFTIELPDSAFRNREGVLDLALRLGRLIAGVYLDGVTYAADTGTRELLGRLLATESQHVSELRVLRGLPATSGMPTAVHPAPASARLDSFLRPGSSAPRSTSTDQG